MPAVFGSCVEADPLRVDSDKEWEVADLDAHCTGMDARCVDYQLGGRS
jgi:hypothetical protein